MEYKEIANLIFPNIDKDITYYENLYPTRNLDDKAIVTRYAPSPTGFIHIGALLASFTERSFAKQTNGVFYLRIEDTDTKRTIDNGISAIIDGLADFGITFDEGPTSETEHKGNYGPYIQSQRMEIYHTFIKHLLERGLAYPCFCSEEELEASRKEQANLKARIGYYGKWATCRHLSLEETINKIKDGSSYVIRIKSPGNFDKRIVCEDLIRGKVEMPENDLDIVIMKSDLLPTYHFAHLVDDYLMRTTHVIRGDEWLPSMPIHVQLFEMFGFKLPKYAHISPLSKMDDGNMRKLSKRKDPEAAMSFYHQLGIPKEAVMMYLATITSSEYEIWQNNNQDKTYKDFTYNFSKMTKSAALFDMDKLVNISKTYISKQKASDLYLDIVKYLEEYDQEFLVIFTKDSKYSTDILNVQREVPKPRKDISYYSVIKQEYAYMYDELYNKEVKEYILPDNIDIKDIKDILTSYITNHYNEADDKETWFNRIKDLSGEFNYAKEVKEYKEDPSKYKGHVGDVSTIIRVALTNRSMTFDLYEIMKLLGNKKVIERINETIKFFSK